MQRAFALVRGSCTLLANETKLLIEELVCSGQPHPKYTNYNLEVGSFTAWLTSELEFHELL